MKDYVKRLVRSGVGKLADLSGLRQQVASLQQQTAHLQQQTVHLQHQLASLQQQMVPADCVRQALNESTGASQGVQLLLSLRYRDLARERLPLPALRDTEFRCFSQNGEDGLLLYLFALIGTTNRKVVEICAGDGIECNAANLIINHGWHGLLFDGNEEQVRRGKEFYARCRDTFVAPPTLAAAWLTAENVNALVAEHGFAGDIDLLSLDIDGIDYWVWKALTVVRPRAVILECNGVWGPHLSVSVPYRPDFRLDFSKQPYYCGASLAAFVKLGREKGYRLVGLQRLGFNALFLRSDTGADLFPELTPAECFARHPALRTWSPDRMPSAADRPEWGEVVEV
jgi:hypothetical protein